VSWLRTLRKLVLGETWTLPAGIALSVAVAGVVRVVNGAGGWWHAAGGWVLAVLLVAALAASLRRGAR
jgi:hypothetical protein